MKAILSYKALEFLHDMLAAPGWAKSDNAGTSVKRQFFAGQILSVVLPELPKVRDLTKGPELTFDDKQFDACQVCMKWHFANGTCPSGVATNELIETFKLLD